jgi:hypothetical protein
VAKSNQEQTRFPNTVTSSFYDPSASGRIQDVADAPHTVARNSGPHLGITGVMRFMPDRMQDTFHDGIYTTKKPSIDGNSSGINKFHTFWELPQAS